MLARNEIDVKWDRSDFNRFSWENLMNKHAKPRRWGIVLVMSDRDSICGLKTNSPRVKRAEVSIEMKWIHEISTYIEQEKSFILQFHATCLLLLYHL